MINVRLQLLGGKVKTEYSLGGICVDSEDENRLRNVKFAMQWN